MRVSRVSRGCKVRFMLRPVGIASPTRQGRLLSSFHLLGHPLGVSNITTRANNQFPWPDFHRLDKQPYRLRTKVTKGIIEKEVKFDELSNRVLGCAIEVHRELGPGLLESTHEQCLAYELARANIPFRLQVGLPVQYKETKLDCGYRMIC